MLDQARIPQRHARRRAELLAAAARLFAADGIGPVTLGRIAAEAGVSQGNLYYWFATKDEVVRALYRAWSAESRLPSPLPQEPEQVLEMLWNRAGDQQRTSGPYSFFQRELPIVLAADPVLAEEYRGVLAERIDALVPLAERAIAAGLLRRPSPPAELRDTIRLLWLVGELADPFAAATGLVGFDAGALTGAALIPLLTEAGRSVLGLPGIEAGPDA